MDRTRDEVFIALDRSFKVLMDCLGQLTEEELTTAQVLGHWTVKDVVAHIWSRVDEAVHTAKAWQEPRPWQEGVTYDDAWNERHVIDRSGLPLISVVDGLTSSHRLMMHLLDILDDEALAGVSRAPWGGEVSLLAFLHAMADHYREHAKALRNYQEHCLEGCD